jgi:hypothetical protein
MYTNAIDDWFNIVGKRYVSRGLTTVYAISGSYVGTVGAGRWVSNLMSSYHSMAPTLTTTTPTVEIALTPTFAPDPTPTLHAKTTAIATKKEGMRLDLERFEDKWAKNRTKTC